MRFHQKASELLEEGRFAELRALASGLSRHDEESAFLWGLAAANLGSWKEALSAFRISHELEPENAQVRDLLSEAMVRLGLDEEAKRFLHRVDHPTEEEEFRLRWLSAPGARLAPLEEAGPVLHPLYGVQRLDSVVMTVAGDVPAEYLADIEHFHQREFPGSTLRFRSPERAMEIPPFETLRDLVDVGQVPPWANSRKPWLVFCSSKTSTGYSAGVGADDLAVMKLEPGDPFAPTIIAHEIYHTLLGLNHTNGTEGPDEPESLMGPLGTRAPLRSTFVASAHRRFCTTQPEVQELVDKEQWQEALRLDPDYLALYRKIADEQMSQSAIEDAAQTLEGWFERDPGPEAASVLGVCLAELGRDPGPFYERTRGYDFEPNTHLYLAQANLDKGHFNHAVSELDTALALAPYHLHGLAMRGQAYQAMGLKDRARNDYETALDLCPEWDELRQKISELDG